MDQRAALQSALQLAAFFKQNCLKCAVFRAKRGERSVGYNAISSGLVATIAHQWQQPASQAAAGGHDSLRRIRAALLIHSHIKNHL